MFVQTISNIRKVEDCNPEKPEILCTITGYSYIDGDTLDISLYDFKICSEDPDAVIDAINHGIEMSCDDVADSWDVILNRLEKTVEVVDAVGDTVHFFHI